MTFQGSKNFAFGAIIGAIGITIVAFSAGWIVTAGSYNRHVAEARVDAKAEICANAAKAFRIETGDTASLAGYSARSQREELAKVFAVMPGQTEADRAVISACADKLDMNEA